MAVLLNSLSCPPSTMSKPRIPIAKPFVVLPKQLGSGVVSSRSTRRHNRVKAFFFNPIQEPILREALKEPVAFMGGVFAGLLRLDLNDDPLKEWVSRTVEASGITTEEIEAEGSKPEEEAPQQIEIE